MPHEGDESIVGVVTIHSIYWFGVFVSKPWPEVVDMWTTDRAAPQLFRDTVPLGATEPCKDFAIPFEDKTEAAVRCPINAESLPPRTKQANLEEAVMIRSSARGWGRARRSD